MCDVTSTSGSKTLFSEVSAPFETGIVVAVDDLEVETALNLIKNGDTMTITVKQMLPLTCPSDDNCVLRVNIVQVPEGLNSAIFILGLERLYPGPISKGPLNFLNDINIRYFQKFLS